MSVKDPHLAITPSKAHPDFRLNARQNQITKRLRARPDAPTPSTFERAAEVEGFYRFLRNPRVKPNAVVQPHYDDVAARTVDGPILVIHDSTKIVHRSSEDADDVYDLGLKAHGYLAHVSFAVSERDGEPLGLLNLEVIERNQERDTEGGDGRALESARWARAALVSAHRLGERAQGVFHVMDSEGDIFAMYQIVGASLPDLVVRAAQNRVVRLMGYDEKQTISKWLDRLPVLGRRDAEVAPRAQRRAPPSGRRNKSARAERTAELELRAGRFEVPRPGTGSKAGGDTITLTLVVAREPSPPPGEPPIEWRLWTSLAVETFEDAERVVDIYRKRWFIEELFKALKTGCAFEKRSYESRATSSVALALYLPVAVHLLRLRYFARTAPDSPVETVLSKPMVVALRAMVPKLPSRLNVRRAFMAIAALGGHLAHNAEPGWLVLARGYEKLLPYAAGWLAARRAGTEDVING